MRYSIAIAATLALVAAPARGADPENTAQAVARLRLEVEALSAELSAERRRAAEARATWAADGDGLELAVAKARARKRALEASLPEPSAPAATASAPDYGILPGLVAALRARVQAGLPFRRQARLSALDTLAAELSSGRAAPGRAAVTLARFLRDERRLAETVGRAREVLDLDGEPRMLEVLRLGLVTLLVQLPDGRAGCTAPRDANALIVFEPGAEAAAVRAAFESYHVHPGGGRTEVPAVCLGGAP